MLSNSDSRYMSLAIEEAQKSHISYQLGCIAVVSGKIVARGCNTYRTYSKDGMIGRACSCHAEIDVLRKCLKQNITKKINIYIARSSNTEELLCSTPCIDCFLKMKHFNIRSIIYVNHDGDITKRSVDDFTTKHTTSGHRAIKSKRVKGYVS
jgi:tRNA(Arg) A34 adenosine deaminase TadA